ncbi:MAG: HEPN domain-containing protein [Bacteroidales bacterium]
MISGDDRKLLIEYRLQQALDTAELAKFLVSSNKLVIAVNRIYYGMYYALTALALKDKFETSKHLQLIGWFNKEYIATKKSDQKYGKILRNAFQNRTKGDYDAFVEFDKTEVEIMISEMIEFVDEIHKLLKK